MIKVLIVEDETFIRKGLIGTFDWTAFKCVIVGEGENGLDGLEKIKKLKPDLVITDIRMPKMNGIEMIKKAKESTDFETFFLTSYDDFSYAKEAIDLRVQEYILKPIDEDELGTDVINVGCTVDVYDCEFEEEIEFKIVGSTEANSLAGKISNESPVGKALIGKKVGDVVEVETQSGIIEYKVLKINRSI